MTQLLILTVAICQILCVIECLSPGVIKLGVTIIYKDVNCNYNKRTPCTEAFTKSEVNRGLLRRIESRIILVLEDTFISTMVGIGDIVDLSSKYLITDTPRV